MPVDDDMPPPVEGEDLSYPQLVVALHQLVETEENLTHSLQRCADLARFAVPGANSVGVTLRVDNSGSTVAYNGESATALDQAQYTDNLGPCLESFREDRMIYVERIATEVARWPTFVREAEKLGIQSSLSMPLHSEDKPVGALNMYACDEIAFSDETIDAARMFAVQASVAITNAEVYWRTKHLADNLSKALDGRDLVGQAKGILMREHGISSEEASERIENAARERDIKVTDLARQIIWTGQLAKEI
ncbi:MAG: GAF and ANTAR domain-containing protein [Microthrixaceae bacterium]